MDPLSQIHPKLRPYTEALISYEFGLQGVLAEVTNIQNGRIIKEGEESWGDRFFLKILYCTRKLNWQVIMNPDNLMEPPDFVMDDNFLTETEPEVIQSEVPSLANWQPEDPKSLLKVVIEFLNLYKSFQGSLINKDSRLFLEYDALIRCTVSAVQDFEILLHSPWRASFLLHLKIDYSRVLLPLPARKYLTLLLVEIGDHTKSISSLIRDGDVEEIYGRIDFPELPYNATLMHYIPFVQTYLQTKVNEMVWRVAQRKIFYTYLVHAFEPALLNGDNLTYRKVSFLLENNGSFYMLNVQIPIKFPDQPPEVIVSSLKNRKSGLPVFLPIEKLPYNINVETEKILKTIYEFFVVIAIPLYEKQMKASDSKSK